MQKFDFNNKRILITQPLVHGINGSTLVTLELASYLKERGASVVVYTYTLDNPARELFEKKDISLSVAKDEPNFKLSDFDYIWVNSQTLPKSLVEDLRNTTELPYFIFLHMSSMDWIPDEHPYIFELEEKLSDLTLYICEEVRKSNLEYFKKEPNYAFFRNPAPLNFLRNSCDAAEKIERVLFVSNYLPEELRKARQILEKKGIKVNILGENEDMHVLLDEKILQQYDAVVSIAKTTHYCLVHNTPIYIYGKFGGCGWLNSANYERAKETNFCGSYGFDYKKPEQIVEEILGGYKKAKSFQKNHHDAFLKDFLISNIVDDIFLNCHKKKSHDFSKEYITMLSSAQDFAKIRFESWSDVYRLQNELKLRDIEAARLSEELSGAKQVLDSRSIQAWLKFNRLIRGKNENAGRSNNI
jgi:hypothetical protein